MKPPDSLVQTLILGKLRHAKTYADPQKKYVILCMHNVLIFR